MSSCFNTKSNTADNTTANTKVVPAQKIIKIQKTKSTTTTQNLEQIRNSQPFRDLGDQLDYWSD